jgi:outer membrane protein assembly factor BamD (BamD/ComL family)
MSRSFVFRFLLVFCLLGFATRLPAPLIYRPGEGWVYEKVGEDTGAWSRGRAKDQLEVAQQALELGNISTALKAAKRLVARWPLSDYAPEAKYIMGRCYEEKGHLQRAFDTYQELIEDYPKTMNYEDVLDRQYEIANRFLNGRWFRLWNYIPMFPSMDRTSKMYAKIVRNGPYSDVGPKAQMAIGEAREKQREYRLAEQAYIRAADRYHELPGVSADAVYRAAQALEKQANKAGYDQGTAGDAIDMFTDFSLLYPLDPRVDDARSSVQKLRVEQALGAYQIARYYEKKRAWLAAEIYYNEVLLMDAQSIYAEEARTRLAEIKDYTDYLRSKQSEPLPNETPAAANRASR